MTEQMQRAIKFRRGLNAMLGASTIEGPAALLCMEAWDTWQPGKVYPAGTVLRYTFEAWGEQLVRTIRTVDTATHPDWTPEGAPSEYEAYHGNSKETARPYITLNNTAYRKGEWCTCGGYYWEFVSETPGLWSPEEYAAAWRKDGEVVA